MEGDMEGLSRGKKWRGAEEFGAEFRIQNSGERRRTKREDAKGAKVREEGSEGAGMLPYIA
jgi:hypothetical protein